MRNRNKRWITFLWTLLSSSFVICYAVKEENSSSEFGGNSTSRLVRGIFAPRMDYEQWKPLGRGDPLKNDPTYDYVPPVLDRVHYWIDPALRKPDPPVPGENQKTEILLLGIASKKPSTGISVADSRKDVYDPFLKFVDAPKFNSQHRYSSEYYPSFYATKNRLSERGSFTKGDEQRVPYTVLMPPPLVTKLPLDNINYNSYVTPQKITSSLIQATLSPTSTIRPLAETSDDSDITVQEANLVYHASSPSSEYEWKNNNPVRISTTQNQITWSTPYSYTPSPFTTTRKSLPFKENVVFQKYPRPPEIHHSVKFSPKPVTLSNNFLVGAGSDHQINYVTPPSFPKKEMLIKGHVSDDNLDISNTYVKIGKTEAQIHSSDILLPQKLKPSEIIPILPPNIRFPIIKQNSPLTMQTLQSMQAMHAPPVITSPVFDKTTNPVLSLLKKEANEANFSTKATAIETTTPIAQTTSTETAGTSTTSFLTTDPLFKHYKQPVEPLKGPLYLIIQGHSKVKTYGPSKTIHGISVQETNEITDDKDDKYRVKHLHNYQAEDEKPFREPRSGNLQTLKHVVQTGLGAIDEGDLNADIQVDMKEAELEAGYEVADSEATTEKYHKGIVEEARKMSGFEKSKE